MSHESITNFLKQACLEQLDEHDRIHGMTGPRIELPKYKYRSSQFSRESYPVQNYTIDLKLYGRRVVISVERGEVVFLTANRKRLSSFTPGNEVLQYFHREQFASGSLLLGTLLNRQQAASYRGVLVVNDVLKAGGQDFGNCTVAQRKDVLNSLFPKEERVRCKISSDRTHSISSIEDHLIS